MVADALQIVGDFHGGRKKAQVTGHGLLGREEPDHGFLDLELELIDLAVAVDHVARFVAIPLQHGVDGRGERGLRFARHIEERDLEL